MKNYHTIAFDLDGTLTDPKRGLTSAFAYGLQKVGIAFESVESLKKFIGPPLRDSFRDEYGLSEKDADDALMLFREYFGVYGWWDNELYEGIQPRTKNPLPLAKGFYFFTIHSSLFTNKATLPHSRGSVIFCSI